MKRRVAHHAQVPTVGFKRNILIIVLLAVLGFLVYHSPFFRPFRGPVSPPGDPIQLTLSKPTSSALSLASCGDPIEAAIQALEDRTSPLTPHSLKQLSRALSEVATTLHLKLPMGSGGGMRGDENDRVPREGTTKPCPEPLSPQTPLECPVCPPPPPLPPPLDLPPLAPATIAPNGGGNDGRSMMVKTPPSEPFQPTTATPTKEAGGPTEEEGLDPSLDPLTGLPLPSTVDCFTQLDGSDTCMYTNACVDAPGPNIVDGGGWLRLHLITTPEGEAYLEDVNSEGSSASPPSHLTDHYAAMRARWPGWGVKSLAEKGFTGGFDPNNVDFPYARLGAEPRALPFSSRATAHTMPPQGALPGVLGGEWGGDVLWLDSLWLAAPITEEHLWTCTSSTIAPLVAAWNANASGATRAPLPPLHNLALMAGPHVSRSFAWDGWHFGQAFFNTRMPGALGWCWGFLFTVLRFLGGERVWEPFLGSGRHWGEAPGGQWYSAYVARGKLEDLDRVAGLAGVLWDVGVGRVGAGPPPPGQPWTHTSPGDYHRAGVGRLLNGGGGGGDGAAEEGTASSASPQLLLGGSGYFPGEAKVQGVILELLEGCKEQVLGGAATFTSDAGTGEWRGGFNFTAPPAGPSPGWTPQEGIDFFSTRYPHDAAGLSFNGSEAMGWSPQYRKFRALLWCIARVLGSSQQQQQRQKQGDGAAGGGAPAPAPPSPLSVPFQALFFRDERGESGGGGRRSAGLSTRIIYTQRDFPMPPAPLTALNFALDSAAELLGEDVLGVWSEALRREVLGGGGGGAPGGEGASSSSSSSAAAGGGGGGGGGTPTSTNPPPPWTQPYADAPLRNLSSSLPLGHLAHFLTHGRRLRVCARRLAFGGGKDTGVGGLTEANLMREMAAEVRARVALGGGGVLPTTTPSGSGGVVPPPILPLLTRGGKGSASYLEPPSLRDPPPPAIAALPSWDQPYGPGHPERVPVLLLDRGQAENGETVVGPYGRRFWNRGEMLGVLAKYGLVLGGGGNGSAASATASATLTLVEDVDLFAMTFEQQAALFNSHKVFIAAHGAGMINTLFMPPRSAIIEVTPRGMWCPLFFRQNVFSGHYVFPIHSPKLPPSQHFVYTLGGGPDQPRTARYNDTQRAFRDQCELRGHFWSAQTSGNCFHEAKTVPAVTPLAEFEVALLHALDAVGAPTQHRGSPLHLLEGIPGEEDYGRGEGEEGVPLLAHTDPEYYKRRSWGLTPPGTVTGDGDPVVVVVAAPTAVDKGGAKGGGVRGSGGEGERKEKSEEKEKEKERKGKKSKQ